jgi:Arc/MetJ-type ribon-helix-helix transcriptional regulator
MATMTIRSTYALDPATVSALADLAKRLGVSKSEALRRAVRLAAGQDAGALEALDAIQAEAGLGTAAAAAWTARNRSERRAASLRREASNR